jgi:hypothetical protein
VLRFSPQGYYKWRHTPVTKRDLANAYLTNQLIDAHLDDPPFGYRFLADELERLGERTCERRVWRLCSEMAIWSSFVKKSRSGKKPGPPVHDDLVQRDFSANAMNQLWFTDLTEHMTAEGKLYLCSLEDAYSSRIVGYSIGERMTSDLCVSALRNAIRLRDPKGTVVHSDRGSISIQCLRPNFEEQRTRRLDGTRGGSRRQRGDGIVSRAVAEERVELEEVGDERGTSPRHRHLGRADLSPPTSQATSRQDDTGRIRSLSGGS